MPPLKARADINPQLCKVFNPAKHVWNKSWIAEPKFDGLRCIVVTDKKGKAKPYSRNGKPLWNMSNILEEVEDVGFQNYILDGEVYTQDWNLSMGIVKSSTVDHPDKDKLNYHIWDSLFIDEWKAGKSDVSNLARKRDRLWPWADLQKYHPHISVVPNRMVFNAEQLQEAYLEFLKDGYEGAILKDPDGIYECGRRSPYWLKIKPWTDADLTVISAYPGEGKHIGRIGGLLLEGEAEWNGRVYQVRTEVGTGFTDEERESFQQMHVDGNLAGRIVEIKFQDITVEGSCRFPVYSRLREDK